VLPIQLVAEYVVLDVELEGPAHGRWALAMAQVCVYACVCMCACMRALVCMRACACLYLYVCVDHLSHSKHSSMPKYNV
jgi:hypothetical protein